jgi:serine/threonine protein kinase
MIANTRKSYVKESSKSYIERPLTCGVLELFCILCCVDTSLSKPISKFLFTTFLRTLCFSIQELIEKIKKAEYEFHSDAWSQISLQAKDLIRCLLNIDVKKRYSPFQALTHPWIENVSVIFIANRSFVLARQLISYTDFWNN